MRLIYPIALLLLALTSPAAAQPGPSFDCAKASNEIERTICADPQLAEADRTMAALYRSLRTSAFGKGLSNQAPAQRAWLAERDTCLPLQEGVYASLTECLHGSYKWRNIQLAESALFASLALAKATLRKLDPKAAPLLEALASYVEAPLRRQPIIELLRQPFERLQSDDMAGYGRSILEDSGIVEIDDALESDANFALTLQILAVYADPESTPVIPCAAFVRNPALLDMAGAVFGSSLDNRIPHSDCSSALPPLPKLEAFTKKIWDSWPPCEGTIRYSIYRSFTLTLDRARLGLPPEGAAVPADLAPAENPIWRQPATRQLVRSVTEELSAYYRQWLDMPAQQAQEQAGAAIKSSMSLAHICY